MTSEFLYHAHAVGLSGRLTSPFAEILEAQAASAIGEAGGVSRSRVENYRFREIISCKAAWSQVTGVESGKKPGTYSTLATSVIEGLNVLDMVTADRMVMRITSKHPGSGGGEPSIQFIGSGFENLRIAGQPVAVELDTATFDDLDTFSKVRERYLKDDGFRADLDRRLLRGGLDTIPAEKHRTRRYFEKYSGDAVVRAMEAGGELRASLVKGVRSGGAECKAWGNVIEIPEFGLIRLAEITVGADHRSLSMLRIEMGCAYEGFIEGGSGAGNGRPWPA
ncbi:MAG: hypothetical protein IPP47_23410 [Bryobacterales bacterium]|nr:hypothetical protein [Bryobacterales bacterium]